VDGGTSRLLVLSGARVQSLSQGCCGLGHALLAGERARRVMRTSSGGRGQRAHREDTETAQGRGCEESGAGDHARRVAAEWRGEQGQGGRRGVVVLVGFL
jgi:hypothetical protein